jgi:hypothetical protein
LALGYALKRETNRTWATGKINNSNSLESIFMEMILNAIGIFLINPIRRSWIKL